MGESLSMIGKLLGHNKIDTTSRYAHLARDSIKASSAREGCPRERAGGAIGLPEQGRAVGRPDVRAET